MDDLKKPNQYSNALRKWLQKKNHKVTNRKKEKRKFTLGEIVTVTLIFLTTIMLVLLVYSRFNLIQAVSNLIGRTFYSSDTGNNNDTLNLNNKPGMNSGKLSTEQVSEQICSCIVGIVQYQKGAIGETGEGTGVILSADGKIITNNHVIDGASKLEVVMKDDSKYGATVIGSDARTDLAVLKINAKNLKYATFGNSDQCKVGEQVVAVGNPSGLQLARSVTQGIISALNRNVDVGNGPMNLIQTDAAINPGNSGGALVNMYGQVIGINSAKIAQTGYEGLGFSIPINTAKPIVDSILKYGYVKGRVKFGFQCKEIDAVTANLNSIPQGIYVGYVESGSSASQNGVKVDDIITEMDGVPVKDTDKLIIERDKHQPGDEVTLTIYRRSEKKELQIKVKLLEDRGLSNTSQDGNW